MLSTLLKTTILAEDVCCILACCQCEDFLSSKTLTNCQSWGGEGEIGAFMLLTEIVLYLHFIEKIRNSVPFINRVSTFKL